MLIGKTRKEGRDPLSSTQMLLAVLGLVFLVEFAVMFLVLPRVIPADASESTEALLDSTLLTFGLAPLLWFVIVRPLRQTAAGERARAASVITTAADGILTMDQHATIRSVNPAMEQILGWPSDELIGEPITRIFGASFAKHCSTLVGTQASFRTDSPEARTIPEIETPGATATGLEVPLTVSLSSFKAGGQHFVTAIAHDLTQRRKAEAEIAARARQQAVVAELGERALAGIPLRELLVEIARRVTETLNLDGCLICERESSGVFVVRACGGQVVEPVCEMQFELSDEERCLWLPAELTTYELSDTDKGQTVVGRELQKLGLSSVTVTMIERPDGEFGSLLACRVEGPSPGRDTRDFLQSVSNVIASALQRERAEHELREKEAIRAEQMSLLAQVATGVAHEIRNPLTSIKMICQTLGEEVDVESAAARDCEIMVDEILRMEQSLNVFLDYARPPRAAFGRVKVADLFSRTSTLLGRRARRQQVSLNVTMDDESIAVSGDAAQLQQLLLNLGLNSLAMMPNGGSLMFSACCTDGTVEIVVCDTGPGVPTELRDQIFEPFFTTKETGVGLGLVICRRIASEHHGTLELGAQDAGAVFVLKLPTIDARSSVENGIC